MPAYGLTEGVFVDSGGTDSAVALEGVRQVGALGCPPSSSHSNTLIIDGHAS